MSIVARVSRTVCICVAVTLASLALLSQASGLGIPLIYWCFGAVCPAVISAAVATRLVRQAECVRQLHAQVQAVNRRLKAAAETDWLTGLLNRGTFFESVAQVREGGEGGWLIILDVDHFKSINDRFGHERGDEALHLVGAALRDSVRPEDMVGRIGGEEFAIYLPAVSEDEALLTAETVRCRIAETVAFCADGAARSVTVSLGICADKGGPLEASLREADLAMYRAKNSGRNRVALAA